MTHCSIDIVDIVSVQYCSIDYYSTIMHKTLAQENSVGAFDDS